MPVSMLMECHERIRRFSGGLTRLAALSDRSGEAAVNTARLCARYFGEALPLHAQDEDESLVPRLSHRPELSAPLAEMQEQHRQIEAMIPAVVSALERIAGKDAAPADLPELLARFVALLSAHITAEEALIFPACADLSASAQAEIVSEIRARRVS